MRGAARVGDVACNGVISLGSANVFVNGSWVSMQGLAHSCNLHAPATILTGCDSVYVNGLAVARIGDVAGCGGSIVTGSTDVFIG